MDKKIYIVIDLKSFYASVECVERGLDPLNTNLIVADKSRNTGTICLAVSPSLKAFGVPSRPRWFEVIKKVKEINMKRRERSSRGRLTGSSVYFDELRANRDLALDYIIAKPQMARYIEVSARIYEVYLKWIAPEDIHVYSIDEVFIDASKYLKLYKMTPKELTSNIILNVLDETGITATGGIGTNLYLAKVAMDIWAKKLRADENGVRIAGLTERSYRENLWDHEPITDFWRIGRGYAKRLRRLGIYTMGDVARYSVHNEDILYNTFGINAELLIDHAWGYEPVTIKDIKSYKPQSQSISNGQVLPRAYSYEEGLIVIKEMADKLGLELVAKGLKTDQIVINIGFDYRSLDNPLIEYKGPVKTGINGRQIPKNVRGSLNLGSFTSSSKLIMEATEKLYKRIVNKNLLIKRLYIGGSHVVDEALIEEINQEQLNLFVDYKKRDKNLQKERKLQKICLEIKNIYGKNAIVRGLNMEEGATGMDRNEQIGGHKA